MVASCRQSSLGLGDTLNAKFKAAMGRDASLEELQTFRGWFADRSIPTQAHFDAYLAALQETSKE